MNLRHPAKRLLAGLAVTLAVAAASSTAVAGNVEYFVPFSGSGNVSVFDAAAGTGGWVGSINPEAPPVVDNPLALVSFVLFTLDSATSTLSGSFEFTTTDLLSTLFGTLSGSTLDADFLNTGGQLALDYTITGGTGLFGDASGFGISFLNFDPAGGFDNYGETGLLSFSVPAPASLALVLAGLLALAVSRRKGAPVNWSDERA